MKLFYLTNGAKINFIHKSIVTNNKERTPKQNVEEIISHD